MVTILCSGMGLGVYNPALILSCRLKKRGVATEVFVIESFFSNEKKEKLIKNKNAFHNNFQIALLGMRMSKGDFKANLDTNQIDQLLEYWLKNQRKHFIILSGHWMGIIKEYVSKERESRLIIDTLRMDCDTAPSWKNFENVNREFNDIWLLGSRDKKIEYRIDFEADILIPFNKRRNQFLIHGGGWGIGSNQSRIEEINNSGLTLDIVLYDKCELKEPASGNRHYLMDFDWNPWDKNKYGEHEFPPTYELSSMSSLLPMKGEDYHPIFGLCLQDKGIVSKPGGGTLLDSLASATPVIFTEPIAKHEKTNADIWESLELGISYDKWKKAGFSIRLLEQVHDKLMEIRGRVPDYIEYLISRYAAL